MQYTSSESHASAVGYTAQAHAHAHAQHEYEEHEPEYESFDIEFSKLYQAFEQVPDPVVCGFGVRAPQLAQNPR